MAGHLFFIPLEISDGQSQSIHYLSQAQTLSVAVGFYSSRALHHSTFYVVPSAMQRFSTLIDRQALQMSLFDQVIICDSEVCNFYTRTNAALCWLRRYRARSSPVLFVHICNGHHLLVLSQYKLLTLNTGQQVPQNRRNVSIQDKSERQSCIQYSYSPVYKFCSVFFYLYLNANMHCNYLLTTHCVLLSWLALLVDVIAPYQIKNSI